MSKICPICAEPGYPHKCDIVKIPRARIVRLEAEVERLRSLPYDGYTVYQALTASAQKRTSPENVSDVLDALALLTKSGTADKGE